jgi:hypothetical protein
MNRRYRYAHRPDLYPPDEPGRLSRESHASLAVEAEFFFRLWQKGHTMEELRADIKPGKESSEHGRKFRMKVLREFEKRVGKAERRVA